MSLQRKFKVGLDETRLQVLGAQVLLGFQFQSTFQQGFPDLPIQARLCDAVALMLMMVTITLLITPAAAHRIVHRNHESAEFLGVITLLATAAMLTFAASLGLDVFIVAERMAGTSLGVVAGASFTALALVFWFGIELAARRHRRETAMAQSAAAEGEEKTPLSTRIDHMLTEARVILPGAQALLGFQLVVVLTPAFQELPGWVAALHATALGLVALTIILLMTPAAYHRLVFGGEDSEDLHRTGSRLIAAATLPLALGLSADIAVALFRITHSAYWAVALAVCALVVLVAFWHVGPLVVRHRQEQKREAA